MSTTTVPSQTTRKRLLEAAGEVFAERGFEHATIRAICRRAKANIASVNYHFRGKASLYADVLAYGAQQRVDAFPPDLGLGPNPSTEAQLHAFIYSFLCRFLKAEGRASWYTALCARELVQPTIALNRVVDQIIRPLADRLRAIVQRLLGPGASADDVRRCALSIVGQCLFYHHSRHVLERLYGPQRYTDAEIKRLADHISRFSLAALRARRTTKERSRP
jgi:AcrR family transcriptional regulator